MMKNLFKPGSRKPSPGRASPEGEAASVVGRRGLVVGAGVAGVAAVSAIALHPGGGVLPAVASAKTGSDADQGYRLTDHVKRYYETTRS